jgi:hypothetical protein
MRTTDHRSAWIVLTTVACLLLPRDRCRAETVEWIRQLGTGSHEDAISVSADGLGNVYIAGETNGPLGDMPNAGGSDAFISKFDAAGNLLWRTPRLVPTSRQIGTSSDDHGYGVSADGLGNVYMSGRTAGSLGGTNAGGDDAFITKWDANGALLWTRQLGTAGDDYSNGVSADGLGNVYITGYTGGSLDGVQTGNDAFVSKFDAAGTLLWTRQPGLSGFDASLGVSADDLGNVVISGNAGAGAFVTKYDAAGALLWTRQLSARGYVQSQGVSTDKLGNVYISGYSDGSLATPSAGQTEAFIRKYDADGAVLWTRQLGSAGNDYSFGASADDLGNVYITGRTQGNLGGTSAGIDDAFVSKFNAAGNLLWTKQLGTSSYEGSLAISADGLGNVYTAGGTNGSLGAANRGFGDAFVAKISDTTVPEPTTGVLFALGALSVWRRR